MRIALDAMGGDLAPRAMIEGAIEAADEWGMLPPDAGGFEIVLVGREDLIGQELGDATKDLPIHIHHAPDIIEMHDHPATAVRRKKESSIVIGMRLLKEHSADAFLSAGNTGAMLAAALLVLGRCKGIDRPGIGSIIPTGKGRTLLIDAGANADVRPENLVQFARMGSIYMSKVQGSDQVSVGLLSNGEEETKGNALTLQTHALLRESGLAFAGNVEGRDITAGKVDVVVADGFTGNVALKAMEGTAETLLGLLRTELTRAPHYKLAALALRPAFRRVARTLDYSEIGGSPLLGVNGLVFIAHGRSNAKAIKNALRAARDATKHDIVAAINQAGEEHQ